MRIPPIERSISNLSPIPEEPEETPPFSLPDMITNALRHIRLHDEEELHIYQYLSARTRIGYNVYITLDRAAENGYTSRLEKFVIPADYKLTEDHQWIIEEL
jgi:hypothetical protein